MDWTRISQLHAVKRLAQLAHKRWNLPVGVVTPNGILPLGANGTSTLFDGSDLWFTFCDGCTPHTSCQIYAQNNHPDEHLWTGAPIVIRGDRTGCVTSGLFLQEDHVKEQEQQPQEASQHRQAFPILSNEDQHHLKEVLTMIANEVVSFEQPISPFGNQASTTTPPPTVYSYDNIIGQSPPMIELYSLLDKVIDSDSTVLVQGENGTGKELIAQAIHHNSRRKSKPFVVQNCSAFHDNLLDSELFGHKKGSFTGAIADKRGLFKVADGGTFFLDEIGDMSPALQVKLLRVLQEGSFIPVGDTVAKQVDVRIIAATNRNLKTMMEKGEFREDLYYRINVINITTPPLRDRKADIPILINHFLDKQAAEGNGPTKQLTPTCSKHFLSYVWPGNVRELENEIERLAVLSGDETIIGDHLLSTRIKQAVLLPSGKSPSSLPIAIQNLERKMIYDVLERNNWNKTRAAEQLQISRRNLIRKVNKYNLTPPPTNVSRKGSVPR